MPTTLSSWPARRIVPARNTETHPQRGRHQPADLAERRREMQQGRLEVRKVFENVDLLVTPTTPVPAPAIAELTKNPELLRPRELLLPAQHTSLQRLGTAGNFRSLRLHCCWASYRPANHWPALGRSQGAAVSARLRASHCVAQALAGGLIYRTNVFRQQHHESAIPGQLRAGENATPRDASGSRPEM